MGWTFYHRDKGETNAAHFAAMFGERREMVVSGTVDGVFYAAVRDRTNGEVSGFLALLRWVPKDYYNFGYKDLSETCGPGEYKAPEAVLNALTPTDDPAALDWRDACRRHHEQRKALRGLRDGDQIVLGSPLRFSNGSTRDTFTVRRSHVGGGRTTVALTDGFGTYRVPQWRDRGVVAIIRDGKRIDTPAVKYRAESAYASRVERLYRYGKDDEVNKALTDRYGKGASWSGLAYLARVEFRKGLHWDRLEWAESVRAAENATAAA